MFKIVTDKLWFDSNMIKLYMSKVIKRRMDQLVLLLEQR